jgi:hypothetical protein
VTSTNDELVGHGFSGPATEKLVIQTLARYGRMKRNDLLRKTYGSMTHFDLDRVLPNLRGKITTERDNGVTYYSLREWMK